MKSTSVVVIAVVAAVLLLSAVQPAYSQKDGVKTTMFKDLDSVMAVALTANADILTPDSYGKARKIYLEASEEFEKGKNLEDIRKKIIRAQSIFTECLNGTKLARVTFVNSLSSRSDAVAAEAPTYATSSWTKAELKFKEAATRLEDGNVKDAQKKATVAEGLYREAELEAINTAYLKETWSLRIRRQKHWLKLMPWFERLKINSPGTGMIPICHGVSLAKPSTRLCMHYISQRQSAR